MYTAIFFDRKENHKIDIRSLGWVAPFDYYVDNQNRWKRVNDRHVTLWLGNCEKEFQNKKVSVIVDAIGKNDKAIAFRVKKRLGAALSKNKTPHITLFINEAIGGKPVDSNKITDWQEIEPFELEGIIEEHE